MSPAGMGRPPPAGRPPAAHVHQPGSSHSSRPLPARAARLQSLGRPHAYAVLRRSPGADGSPAERRGGPGHHVSPQTALRTPGRPSGRLCKISWEVVNLNNWQNGRSAGRAWIRPTLRRRRRLRVARDGWNSGDWMTWSILRSTCCPFRRHPRPRNIPDAGSRTAAPKRRVFFALICSLLFDTLTAISIALSVAASKHQFV